MTLMQREHEYGTEATRDLLTACHDISALEDRLENVMRNRGDLSIPTQQYTMSSMTIRGFYRSLPRLHSPHS